MTTEPMATQSYVANHCHPASVARMPQRVQNQQVTAAQPNGPAVQPKPVRFDRENVWFRPLGAVNEKALVAGVVTAAFCGAPALAADMATKAVPTTPAAPPYNWTGFYIGGNVGYGWGDPNSVTSLTGTGVQFGTLSFAHSNPLRFTGVVGGPQVGYNWQVSPNWVYGLEADWQASSEKAAATNSDPYSFLPVIAGTATTNYEARLLWFGTVRGRVGYAWDRLMIYGTGGLAYGDVKVTGTTTDIGGGLIGAFNGAAPFGASKVSAGWTVGAGVEGPLVDKWTWKVEYLYLDLGSLGFSAPGAFAGEAISGSAKFTDSIVRAGLNLRLN